MAARVAQIAAAFHRHRIEFLVLGNTGAVLLGALVITAGVDVFVQKTPANLRKLVACLRDLGFERVSEVGLERTDVAEFEQPNMKLDVAFSPLGLRSFASARSRKITLDLGGVQVPVACLEDIIASKEAADRARDREALPVLRATLAMRRAQGDA